jgi:hypothetical protein
MGTTKQKGWWQSAKSRGKKKGKEKQNTPLEERAELPSLCRSTAKLILVRHSARVAHRERHTERDSGSGHLICSKYTSGTCTPGPFSVQVASMILLPPTSSNKAKWLLLLSSLFSFFSLFLFWVSSLRSLQNPTKHRALHN